MSNKGMTWDAAADRKLLLGVLKMHNVSIDNEAMAKYMSTDDVVCTASAIQNRVKKLRAMAKEEGGDTLPTATDAATKAKATPRKRAAAAGAADGESSTKKGKGKAGKGKSKAAPVEEEAGDDIKEEAEDYVVV